MSGEKQTKKQKPCARQQREREREIESGKKGFLRTLWCHNLPHKNQVERSSDKELPLEFGRIPRLNFLPVSYLHAKSAKRIPKLKRSETVSCN